MQTAVAINTFSASIEFTSNEKSTWRGNEISLFKYSYVKKKGGRREKKNSVSHWHKTLSVKLPTRSPKIMFLSSRLAVVQYVCSRKLKKKMKIL